MALLTFFSCLSPSLLLFCPLLEYKHGFQRLKIPVIPNFSFSFNQEEEKLIIEFYLVLKYLCKRETVKKQQSEEAYIYFGASILFSSPLPTYYQSGLFSVRNTNWFISYDVSLGPAISLKVTGFHFVLSQIENYYTCNGVDYPAY